MTRLGVCGWPVAHSRSPRMHNAALAALGLDDWRYQLLPVPPERFAETVRALPQVRRALCQINPAAEYLAPYAPEFASTA